MLLGTTLALAMVLPYGQLHAEILKNFKVTGQMDLQTTSARNVSDFSTHAAGAVANNDRIGSAQGLLLVNAGWDLLDDVHAMITLGKNDRDWGTIGGNVHGNTQSQPIGTAGSNILGSTFVDQAYVKIDKVFGAMDTTLGRQFYGTQGDLVAYFGPRVGILGMPITALDTLRVDWANDMLGVTGIAGKTSGNTVATTAATPPLNAETDLTGITAMLKGHENMNLGAYVYEAETHFNGALGTPNGGAGSPIPAAGGLNTSLWVVGAKGKLSMGPIWAGAEFAKNFGTDRSQTITNFPSNYTGWAGKVDAGLKAELAGLGSVGPWGEFAYGTGQRDTNSNQNRGFTPIAGDYRAGEIYTRFNNLSAVGLGATALPGGNTVGNASLNNRVIWGLGVKLNPSMWQKLSAGVSYWDYRAQVSPIAATGGAAVLGGNKHFGSEADLDLGWKHSENVSFDAGVGRFWAGGAVNNALAAGTGSNPATALWGDVHLKF